MRQRHALSRTLAVALVVGLVAWPARPLSPPRVAAAMHEMALPALPLVHRFAVGATTNDIAVIPLSRTLLVAQSAAGRALALDEGTGQVRARIHLVTEARHVAVDAVLEQVYLPDEYSGRLIVARYGQGWSHVTLTAVGVGLQPHGVAVDPQTHRVYVTNERGATVSIVDGRAPRLLATVPVGRGPGGVGVAARAGVVYVVLVAEDRVVVLDAATGQPRRSIPVGRGPTHLDIDQATGRAVVVNTTAGTLSVVDGRRGTAAAPLAVGARPYNVADDGARGLIFVASATVPQVTVVDARRAVVLGALKLDMVPGALAIDPTRRLLIVGGADRPSLEIFSYRSL